MTNELLLHRARNGDSQAFEALMTPMEGLIWRVCWHYMNQREDAQDAAQETMLRVWRSLGDFRGDAQLETWVYRLAVNCCLDALRKKKLRAADSIDQLRESGFDPVSQDPGMEEQAEALERRDEIRAAIRRLPEEQRTPLILSAIEGRSYEEIAQITDTALGTVKSRISRARSALSEMLKSQEQTAPMRVKESRRRAKQ